MDQDVYKRQGLSGNRHNGAPSLPDLYTAWQDCLFLRDVYKRQPIMNLSNFYNQMITNIAGAERVFEIMDTPSAITDQDGVRAVSYTHLDVYKRQSLS